MLSHWRNKEIWINSEGPSYPLKEIWDGSRFKEVSWFWDPRKSWIVPEKCLICNKYNQFNDVTDILPDYLMICEYCDAEQSVQLQVARGDPRNIGLIGHFDGWQPNFGRSGKHSSGENLM